MGVCYCLASKAVQLMSIWACRMGVAGEGGREGDKAEEAEGAGLRLKGVKRAIQAPPPGRGASLYALLRLLL